MADVSQDTRFNVKIDQQTGYITKSILCMPIIIQVIVLRVLRPLLILI